MCGENMTELTLNLDVSSDPDILRPCRRRSISLDDCCPPAYGAINVAASPYTHSDNPLQTIISQTGMSQGDALKALLGVDGFETLQCEKPDNFALEEHRLYTFGTLISSGCLTREDAVELRIHESWLCFYFDQSFSPASLSPQCGG